MEIIYEVSDDILIAGLFGELDHHGAAKIRRDIDDMLELYGSRHLIFDFSRVTFMDSAGIGVILGRYRKLQSAGGKVAIASCSPKIRNILNMAGIFSIMEYADTKIHALKILKGKEVS
ncbi:MAG: anti-sigma F factor antagonist [Firmicutes bacterium]|nr:anti-sigma F factor antagonist [Bacillota bacterium]